MNTNKAKASWKGFGYFLLYAIAAILLFLPVINKYFVSDDFTVLKRVCLDRTIWVQGFFRPLTDISLYLNYLVVGLNPFGFNLVNILIHSFNSYLLFQLCCKWRWTSDMEKQRRYAVMASILFLTYPFHNEAVVWILGRGSCLAGTFGISALLVFFSSLKNSLKYSGVCFFYFIGLLAYESIIVLPSLIFILLIEKKVSGREYFKWTLAFFITVIVHFIVRYELSSAVFGSYGENLLKTPWMNYPGNIFKVIARLIIPPINNSSLFLGISVLVTLIIIVISLSAFARLKSKITVGCFVWSLLCILSCTLIVPFLFAVSTKTSESDRFLYLPSFFLCCFVSFLINRWIISPVSKQLVFASLCIYNIIFLELNNLNWHRAGKVTYAILQTIRSDISLRIFIINLPNEIKGAYVFREGFKDALIINNIDTARVTVINKLTKELKTDLHEIWKPVSYKTKLFIPPLVQLEVNVDADTLQKKPGIIYFKVPSGSKIYYWNQHELVVLKAPFGFL